MRSHSIQTGQVTEGPIPDRPVLWRRDSEDRVDALLSAYDYWRRQKKVDVFGPGGTWLGRLVRLVQIARGERQTQPPQIVHDDVLMIQVGRLVHALPPTAQDGRRIRQVVWEEYCGPLHWTQRQKAARVGVTPQWYRILLAHGKKAIDRQVDWDRITVVRPIGEVYSWLE